MITELGDVSTLNKKIKDSEPNVANVRIMESKVRRLEAEVDILRLRQKSQQSVNRFVDNYSTIGSATGVSGATGPSALTGMGITRSNPWAGLPDFSPTDYGDIGATVEGGHSDQKFYSNSKSILSSKEFPNEKNE